MSEYRNISSLRIGKRDFAVRANEIEFTRSRGKKKPATGTIQFDLVGTIKDETWRSVLEMISAAGRRTSLAQEIRAAECELFAAMLRYWSFL